MFGFSAEKLARIPAFLQAQVEAGALPGALTLIWRRGALAHQSQQGLIDRERSIAMRDDAIFRLYSMTKPVTVVALLMLLEQGKVALDDTVAKYIPGFANLKLADGTVVGGAMTVRDLLRHTSGLTYGFHNRTLIDAAYRKLRISEMDTEGGLPAMITQLESLPLEYKPGTAWTYSVATDVAGYVVQVISGQSFADFVREKMKLLEMNPDFLDRSVNEGFSGGEKKRNEILQMALLEPRVAILDETDSGLDIDALRIVAGGVNQLANKDNAVILVTHYQRLLNYIEPDYVHVTEAGRIIKTGPKALALELESRGYDWLSTKPGAENGAGAAA